MTTLFLLQLIADLLSDAKPTQEKIDVVKKIVANMIQAENKPQDIQHSYALDDALDAEARQAKAELT